VATGVLCRLHLGFLGCVLLSRRSLCPATTGEVHVTGLAMLIGLVAKSNGTMLTSETDGRMTAFNPADAYNAAHPRGDVISQSAGVLRSLHHSTVWLSKVDGND
jgi:hypothetical protein